MVLDIQRNLKNWIQNYQKQGLFPTDARIWERALSLVRGCGDATARETITNANWLERFKQQYNFITASPSMNVPDTNKSGSTVQRVPSTGTMLGFMVGVPTVLPYILRTPPEVSSY